MAGDAVSSASQSRSENGRVVRRRVSKYTYSDKENFNVFGGNVGENQKRSPLPVGYPRKPLNDITAVLQSLGDQFEEGSTRPRKPFTRSQNLGICSGNCELLETTDRTGSETGSSKKSKGKSNVLAQSTKAAKMANSIYFAVSLDTHDKENLGLKTRTRAETKTKTVTLAEAESFSGNVHEEVSLPELSIHSKDEPSLGEISVMHEAGETSTKSGMPETGEVPVLVREENNTSAVAMNSTEDSRQEVESGFSFPSTIDDRKRLSRHTTEAGNTVEVEDNTVSSRTSNQRAREQKQQKTLTTRSSVSKFR